jgi:hypothetical protein
LLCYILIFYEQCTKRKGLSGPRYWDEGRPRLPAGSAASRKPQAASRKPQAASRNVLYRRNQLCQGVNLEYNAFLTIFFLKFPQNTFSKIPFLKDFPPALAPKTESLFSSLPQKPGFFFGKKPVFIFFADSADKLFQTAPESKRSFL